MKRNRKEILKDIIQLNGELDDLQIEILQYSWDTEEPILIINKNDIEHILKKCIDGVIDVKLVEDWANFIECRDDLDFEESNLQNIIFELANPYLHGEITKNVLKEMIKKLNLNNSE